MAKEKQAQPAKTSGMPKPSSSQQNQQTAKPQQPTQGKMGKPTTGCC